MWTGVWYFGDSGYTQTCIHMYKLFLASHKQRKEWLGRTHSMLLQESGCVYITSFRAVAPFFFLAKVSFLAVFECRKGFDHINTENVPVVTLNINIYVFVGLTRSSVNRGYTDR